MVDYKDYDMREDSVSYYKKSGWMDDPVKRAEYDKCLAELDEKLRAWTDVIEDGERITEKDLSLIIY